MYGTIACLQLLTVILGSDTDIWVYGMSIGCGWLGNKMVYVERAIGSDYVCLNALSETVMNHPKLKKIPFPSSLATVYMLTGGDYISSFFRTSKQTLHIFIENIEHM